MVLATHWCSGPLPVPVAGFRAPIPIGRCSPGLVIGRSPAVVAGGFSVPAAGGHAKPVPVSSGFPGLRAFPWFLPDGRHYLHLYTGPGKLRVIRVGSLDSPDVTELGASQGHAVYVSGHVLYRREGAVVAQPFDTRTMQALRMPPRTVRFVQQMPNFGACGPQRRE